jgi:AraC-like DNA-binding protein
MQLPRALGVVTRLAYAHAKASGIAATPLLERAGLSRRQIEDPRVRVRVRDQVEFLNLVAAAAQDDLLGFHMAQHGEPRAAGLYYYVLASSGTMTEVFQRAARYSSLVNEGVIQQFFDGRVIGIRTVFSGVSRYRDRHQVEFWTAMMLRLIREFTGVHVTPQRLSFAHPANERGGEMKGFFGCNIEFGAAIDELVFPKSVGTLPVVNADPHLNRVLLAICEDAYARRSTNRGSVRTRVENEIAGLLPHGKARAAFIANRLGMSQRTLARHLAEEGTSFSKMLGEIRRDLATRYLKDETLSISQIAWLLGFQDLGAFSHAFKRWHGTAPRNAAARAR